MRQMIQPFSQILNQAPVAIALRCKVLPNTGNFLHPVANAVATGEGGLRTPEACWHFLRRYVD